MRFYLGGPISGCSDDEAKGWREAVKQLLRAKGHEYLDPMDRDYRGREMEPDVIKEIVEYDKKDIAACDALLVSSPRPSYGTAMEIMYGYDLKKPVYVAVPYDTVPSPWVTYHSAVVHKGSVMELLDMIMAVYNWKHS